MKSTSSSMLRALVLLAFVTALGVAASYGRLDAQQPAADAAAIKALQWREIGPANPGGRISAIVGVPGDPRVFYVGAAAGGVFKTTNAGTTFDPIFDQQSVQSIGDIAVGGLAIGGLAAGGITLGGLGIGLVSLGGVAIGVLAAGGGLALGGILAIGGAAISLMYAIGGLALAPHFIGGNGIDPEFLQLLEKLFPGFSF
jgi:hypothetical protein